MPQTFNVGSRSRFVTFVAWLFLLLSAFACAWAMIQNATQSSWVAELGVDRSALPWLSAKLVHYLPWVLSSAAALFDGMVTTARVLAGFLTLAAGLVLAGIIRRLMSPAIRQEFA